jgi:Tat protein translocase TatC
MFKFKFKKPVDSEDMFADTRMSFGDHLEDLRTHLWRAISGFCLIMIGVFVFDGIGMLTGTKFGIGRPMLDFITWPVKEQLEEFHERRVQKLLRNLQNDPSLIRANQPRFVQMSIPRIALEGQPSVLPDAPLPPEGQAVSYADLITRSQFQVNAARDALQQQKWTVLEAIVQSLRETARRFNKASKVPPDAQAELAEWSEQMTQQIDGLAEFARAKKDEKSSLALAKIQDLLGNKGLVTTWVRIEEPLVFSAMLNRAIGWTQGRFEISTMSIMEAFMAYFKVALMCGFVLGSPWIFYQLWSFVAAGLYPHEKRLVNVYLPFSLLLFLLGVLACQFFVIPKAVGALLWFNEWLDMQPDLRFNEWLSFAIMMPVVFGISFQLPLVMMFLERIGITTVQTYLSYWKIAFFLIHVLAAFLMPTPDIFSMEMLAVPLFGLYGLGILLCKLNPRSEEREEETAESKELVEV